VVAHAVSQRAHEIGIRLALGASRGGVVRHVVAGSAGVVLAGVPVGLALAVALARGAARFLFGVGAADPVTLGAASLVVIAAGLVASWLPARRTARIDPLAALRADG
jgi:putative ABC transport system permease protein